MPFGTLRGSILAGSTSAARSFLPKGTAETMLADMAWTAGVGRSHFDYRAGVVFGDVASLRDGLKTLAEVEERSQPLAATKVAFAYTGEGSQWVGMGQALYECEPVVRAVLDRCDAILREERGASLLDAMFDRADSAGALDDPAWMQPAMYALECALTALWSSVGIRPSAVVGQGLGELAAAQAAGVFGLEEGLRVAVARGAEEDLEGIEVAPPALTLVSSAGQVVESDDAFDGAYWQRQAREPVAFDRCVETLTELGVQVVVEIGPDAVLGPLVASAWPASDDGAGDAGRVVQSAAGFAGRRWLRGGGCRRVRGGAGGFLCGVVRWGDALPNFAAELSVPAPTPLDRSAVRFLSSGLTQRASLAILPIVLSYLSTIVKGLRTWPQPQNVSERSSTKTSK